MAGIDTTDLFDGRNLIVFDGECVLCSGFFRFVLKRDKTRRFEFATARSPLGQRMYMALNLPVVDYETNLVIVDGKVFQRLDAFAAAVRALPGVWPFLSLVRFLPSAVKDPLYFSIARNRYALFGRYDTCMMPDAALLERFAEQGFDA
ncbi:thiol-disulfide oxidoreductase DCC family protein [Ruegeria profundi]|uniref:thiol-disulfide oxidoreductase DCC family protein n=1 Tax=Ruegeria profundi TaxID=1685378 RepID=UPI003C79F798